MNRKRPSVQRCDKTVDPKSFGTQARRVELCGSGDYIIVRLQTLEGDPIAFVAMRLDQVEAFTNSLKVAVDHAREIQAEDMARTVPGPELPS